MSQVYRTEEKQARYREFYFLKRRLSYLARDIDYQEERREKAHLSMQIGMGVLAFGVTLSLLSYGSVFVFVAGGIAGFNCLRYMHILKEYESLQKAVTQTMNSAQKIEAYLNALTEYELLRSRLLQPEKHASSKEAKKVFLVRKHPKARALFAQMYQHRVALRLQKED